MRTPRDDGRLEEVGRRIRSLRVAHGLSQEGLATVVGLHRTYISSVERGQRNVTLIVLWKLAEALGCDAGDLCAAPDERRADGP